MSFKIWLENREINKKLLGQNGPYKIYSVNASAIRDKSTYGDGFNHFATHLEFPSIVPNNEIWISQDINQKEINFLIHNGINQYQAKKKGIKDPYDYALRREKQERQKVDGKDSEKVYYKLYCEIKSDQTKVWLVDGEIVRDVYKTDFIEGGNPEVYKWIPQQEIWIEKNLKEKGEVDITVLHEYVERTLMHKMNFSYAKAHKIATKVDFHNRSKFDKINVIDLSEDEAIEMAKKYIQD